MGKCTYIFNFYLENTSRQTEIAEIVLFGIFPFNMNEGFPGGLYI